MTHVLCYEALTQARYAMNSGRLTPLAAAFVDECRFLVIEPVIDDPDGLEPLTPEVTDACVQLAKFGTAARFQSDAERERRRIAKAAAESRKPPKTAEARLKIVKALNEKKRGRLSKRARALRIRDELEKLGTKVSLRTVERDLEK